MATTTNFGWETPDDTDLVKDGALAMRTLGNAIDASLVDLKGGTTGQVLSKNSNTDMDFTWVTSDDANAIQNAIVDAKGDLITATAADTPARLAVGNNGETLVADSLASTGLRWQTPKTQNAVYNSAFDIWQRGTSFTGTSPYYGADRWIFARAGAAAGATWSRQSSGLTGLRYSVRGQRDSGNTSVAELRFGQSLETSDSVRFAGKTVTLSLYAKAGANYSGGSSAYVAIYVGTGTDEQYWVNGYTGGALLGLTYFTPTTSWQRYTVTATVGANVTEIAFGSAYSPSGTAGANDWLEITGIQLEEGSVATPYTRQSATLAGELAACQRYYYRINSSEGSNYSPMIYAYSRSTTSVGGQITFPVKMRVSPTSLDTANLAFLYAAGTITGLSSVALDLTNPSATSITGTVGSMTANLPGYVVANNSSAAFIGFNAEL